MIKNVESCKWPCLISGILKIWKTARFQGAPRWNAWKRARGKFVPVTTRGGSGDRVTGNIWKRKVMSTRKGTELVKRGGHKRSRRNYGPCFGSRSVRWRGKNEEKQRLLGMRDRNIRAYRRPYVSQSGRGWTTSEKNNHLIAGGWIQRQEDNGGYLTASINSVARLYE